METMEADLFTYENEELSLNLQSKENWHKGFRNVALKEGKTYVLSLKLGNAFFKKSSQFQMLLKGPVKIKKQSIAVLI